jgi:hypothetical protein
VIPTWWAAVELSLTSKLLGSETLKVLGRAAGIEKIALFRAFVNPPKLTTEPGFIEVPSRKLPLG